MGLEERIEEGGWERVGGGLKGGKEEKKEGWNA